MGTQVSDKSEVNTLLYSIFAFKWSSRGTIHFIVRDTISAPSSFIRVLGRGLQIEIQIEKGTLNDIG